MSEGLREKVEWAAEHILSTGETTILVDLDYYDLLKIKRMLAQDDFHHQQLLKSVKEQSNYRKMTRTKEGEGS